MKVPILDLNRQYSPLKKDVFAAWERLFDASSFILGKEVEAFEAEVAKYLGVKYALGVNSGTDALTIAIKALGLKPGDKVLTSPFTFFGTVSAICNANVEPVFADIDPKTFNIDPKKAEEAIKNDPKIRALMPVHLYGYPADLGSLDALAKRNGLYLIEDAAQAIGTNYQGKKIGGFGDFATFSFYPTKNLGAVGDAGLMTTNDEKKYQQAKLIRNHGATKTYYHDIIGGNFRIDALQAAALRIFLPHLDSWIEKRRRIAGHFNERLSARQEVFECPHLPEHHTYHQYTLRVLKGERDALKSYLDQNGVAAMIYYPVPCHLQAALDHLKLKAGTYPNTERACQEVISLPVFPEMKTDEQEHVVQTLLSWKP